MGKIRIESDGTPHGTHVIDTYTGEEIKGILDVQVNCDVNILTAILTLVPGEVDIIVEQDNIIKKEGVPDSVYEEVFNEPTERTD